MFGLASSVKRNVAASWCAHAAALVIGFFLMPYVIGVLGDRQYGSWVFINSIASYAGILYFGFGDTISRYVAKHHAAGETQRLNQIVTLVLAVYLCMGGVALAIACGLSAAAPWLSDWDGDALLEVRLTILVLGVNVATGMTGSVFGGVLMGLRRFDLERGVSFASDVLRLALILAFLRQEWGILTIALIFTAITICENLAYVALAYRCLPELSIRRAHLSWDVLRECSAFSSMAFLSAIAYQLTFTTDSVVIGCLLGAEAIVPYYVALRLAQFIKQPIDKISQICMPTAGALSGADDRPRLQRFLLQAFGTVLLLVSGMFLGAWFFGGDVIRTWVGRQYGSGHHILTILLAAQIVALPCGVLRAFLFGIGKVRAPALLYLAEAVCNVLLSIVLCLQWGVVGVAWGTLLPVVIIELAVLLPYALGELGISCRRLWRDAVAPQLPALAALGLYSWWVARETQGLDGWPALIAVTLGGGVVLGAAWLGTHQLRVARRTAAAPTA